MCLEGTFSEARANAIWLRDVNPDVFQYLLLWLYNARLDIVDEHDLWETEGRQKACELLCQMHVLGERLLFDTTFLRDVEEKLDTVMDTVMEAAKQDGIPMPWIADIMSLVLSESAPYQYVNWWDSFENPSLRPSLLRNLRTLEFFTTFEFSNCGKVFALDGGFAAELMMYLAEELKWAVELWGAQTQSSINIAEKKLQEAQESGDLQALTKRPKKNLGRWLASKYACTYTLCTTMNFRLCSHIFEQDGFFAAEILDFMATELKWIVEKWGRERGPKVDVAQEKEDERWNENDYHDIERLCWKNNCR